jgi:hypothetical protein
MKTIQFTEAAKELSLSKFKDMFEDLGEFAKLEGEAKEKALAGKWQELTGKKLGAKNAPEIKEGA